jgi:type III pantothenate kinase
MMLLDVGNSAVKWAIEHEGVLTAGGRFFHNEGGFSRSASRAWEGLPAPRVLAVASVAGAGMEREISEWVGKTWNTVPRYIRAAKLAAGVTNAYLQPNALGADRWAAMIAAHHASGNAVCVIDCGTAITIDVVDDAGIHQGGLIAPGLDMMKRSLVKETAAIGSLPGEAGATPPLLSRNTADAVNSGVMRMAAALIDRVIGELASGYGRTLEAVITGGDAERLLPVLCRPARYDRDLVLKGVAILAREMLCVT